MGEVALIHDHTPVLFGVDKSKDDKFGARVDIIISRLSTEVVPKATVVLGEDRGLDFLLLLAQPVELETGGENQDKGQSCNKLH